MVSRYVLWFQELTLKDVPLVGGKNASLGEMLRALSCEGVRVPIGFATTAGAYWATVDAAGIRPEIERSIGDMRAGRITLQEAGRSIRKRFMTAEFPDEVSDQLVQGYRELSKAYHVERVDVAVRSSATAEDLPQASFAGQQETFLNVVGEHELLQTCRRCFASLFTDRAISYRETYGFDHLQVALSIGVQKMVRADLACSGVMFTLDTETGFPHSIIINGAWGLGENVVQGAVTPDQFTVFKPLLDQPDLVPIIEKTLGAKEKKLIYATGGTQATKNIDTPVEERARFVLSDEEIVQLARWAAAIERHYERPMDIEWAKDGLTHEVFIVQARPETVMARRPVEMMKTYRLKGRGRRLLTGVSIGQAIAAGQVCILRHASEIDAFVDGAVLVTGMTDPDWVPIMKRAAGIITDFGGRTCHAAIVSRELGVPAVVGTGSATSVLANGQPVTLSCAEGDQGYVYDGILEYEAQEMNLDDLPRTMTRLMMNVGEPSAAMRWWNLPVQGIGLARMEFIINDIIKVHPMALLHPDQVRDIRQSQLIDRLTRGYSDKSEYFIDLLARAVARIAASQFPHPVIVRMSDFKTNEYAELIGGDDFEPLESNPMIGWRGASRYVSPGYRDGFMLECLAIKRARERIGMENVIVMIPFCRTLEEADAVLEVMAAYGLKRGENGLQVYVMAEIPSNVMLAAEFAARFDGFSIGSNDLTQLTLGVDRDSHILASVFDERNEAVKRMIAMLIEKAHEAGAKVGICGQAPSDYPEFAEFLVSLGIDSISLNPDSVIPVTRSIAACEARLLSRVIEPA